MHGSSMVPYNNKTEQWSNNILMHGTFDTLNPLHVVGTVNLLV